MNPDPCDKCQGMSHRGPCPPKPMYARCPGCGIPSASYTAGCVECVNRKAYRARRAAQAPVADYDPNDATDRKYYDAAGIKAIDIIEAYGLNFALGCVVKYVLRAGRKTADKVKDLEKAHWYLGREIERLKAAK